MSYLARRTAIACLALATLGPAVNRLQAGSPQRTAVELSDSKGAPGNEVTIPVELRVGDARVGSIDLQFPVPTGVLTFTRAELGGSANAAGVQITSAAVVDEETRSTSIRVRLTAAAGAASGIPGGPVAFIIMDIAKDAAPGSVIPIRPRATVATAGNPPAIIKDVDVPAREVTVSSAPIISCFFYMH